MTEKIDIECRLQQAVQSYWDARTTNKKKQVESGKIDAKDLSFARFTAALRGHAVTFLGSRNT